MHAQMKKVVKISPLKELLPAIMTLSFLAGPNFRVISCLCLWTAKWSSFVNLFVRSKKEDGHDNKIRPRHQCLNVKT